MQLTFLSIFLDSHEDGKKCYGQDSNNQNQNDHTDENKQFDTYGIEQSIGC